MSPKNYKAHSSYLDQTFNFNIKGKKGFAPLHYAILKNNYEAFIFMVKEDLVNVFALDDLYRTPRSLALINSPFYKILYRVERNIAIKRAESLSTDKK